MACTQEVLDVLGGQPFDAKGRNCLYGTLPNTSVRMQSAMGIVLMNMGEALEELHICA